MHSKIYQCSIKIKGQCMAIQQIDFIYEVDFFPALDKESSSLNVLHCIFISVWIEQ
jgi:hypothetical protein